MIAAIDPTEIRRWLPYHTGDSGAVRLFCLPPAGGLATQFLPWRRQLPRYIRLEPVQPAGHGNRVAEAPETSLEAMADRLAHVVAATARGSYTLFGHSMGALLAFETARALRRAGGAGTDRSAGQWGRRRPPVAGRVDPHRRPRRRPDARLPAGDRRNIAEALANGALMEYRLPLLRADFLACETYEYRPETPLRIPITAFRGDTDPQVTAELNEAWSRLTESPFRGQAFRRGHFFIDDDERGVLLTVEIEMRSWLRRTRDTKGDT